MKGCRFCAFLALTMLGIASRSSADSYRDSLIQKYPYYNVAVGKYAMVYPALAKQIVQDYGIRKGVCVDIGGGCGSLSLALAKITNLTAYVLDIDPVAVRLCNLLADEEGMTGRVRAVEGDARNLPFRNDFADLVVSRGSIFFWSDQLAGIKEAYRILKPGGAAYMGGGFSRLLAPEIRDPLVRDREEGMAQMRRGGWKPIDRNIIAKARAAGIHTIRLISEKGVGTWIELRKPFATPLKR
ncbi:MAG: class I SAM-dependent methyltransferase [Armatimonadetes bacterium]|nr:class I SAM-dependent methyltransferase [Armatimonadota bacterium]